ncbi:hypothetical protein HJA_10795 [Hyphomonas jannaschiana VP2]|uniref:Pentapeptide repeat-containing protein n=1 Tax=Hyphomonas jannaschiana VP2 TaxID=1280952 RepID=A0A059FBS0_9PROT|nr:hypothetical protein HJA_10795 [Hyphomonas jannaschiana VP2]
MDAQKLKQDWLADWRKADFSWNGKALKDTGTPSLYNYAVRRPHGFPEDGRFQTSSPGISAQDYWRWSLGLPGPSRLLSDDELTELGLLVTHEGTTYHLLHAPTLEKDNPHLDNMIAERARLSMAPFQVYDAEDPPPLYLDGGWLPTGTVKRLPSGSALMARLAHFDTPLYENTLRYMHCQRSLFSGAAIFTGIKLTGKMDFAQSVFLDDAWCDEMTIGGDASFGRCAFLARADFNECEIDGDMSLNSTRFAERANLSLLACSKDLWFWDCDLQGGADADSMKVGGKLYGRNMKCNGSFDCRASIFRGPVDFDGTRFAQSVSFSGSMFEDTSSFARINWPDQPIDNAFADVRFRDRANFDGEDFAPVSALNHVTFDVPPVFPEPHESAVFERQYRAAVARTRAAIRRDRTRDPKAASGDIGPARTADQRWAALSGGYRTLKNIAREHGDFFLEQTYYRYEIKSRMKRPKVSMWEKAVAAMYGAVSDYGSSVARPFVALFAGLIVFSTVYLAIGLAVDPPVDPSAPEVSVVSQDMVWQSWEFSWNNTFRPLSALSTDAPREGDVSRLQGRLLYDHGGAVAALVRGVATLQSLLSVVLAFLFALAVRRRFQIDA